MTADRRSPKDVLRRAYRRFKASRLGLRPGPVRRIDRVFPPRGRRVVAMTFDDGPCAAPVRPETAVPVPSGAGHRVGLTAAILDTLKAFGARGTFDVIGSTRWSYPDHPGRLGGVYWCGVHFDHYPEFGADDLAGVLTQDGLARRMVDEGHELANHGFTHLAFGPCRYPYAARRYLPGLDAVVDDLRQLHQLVRDRTGQVMRLARPPHYIDRTIDGRDAYDAYRVLGYLYLGASFDGGGWKPSGGDFARDVADMVAPLEAALQRDPDWLNGQIIFQKDGYNMSAESPVAVALGRHLELLARHDYQVVTVSELMALSPFSDIGEGHPAFEAARALQAGGANVAFADNEVKPARPATARDIGRIAPALYPLLVSPDAAGGGSPDRTLGGAELEAALAEFVRRKAAPDEERARSLARLKERASVAGPGPLTRGGALTLLAAAVLDR